MCRASPTRLFFSTFWHELRLPYWVISRLCGEFWSKKWRTTDLYTEEVQFHRVDMFFFHLNELAPFEQAWTTGPFTIYYVCVWLACHPPSVSTLNHIHLLFFNFDKVCRLSVLGIKVFWASPPYRHLFKGTPCADSLFFSFWLHKTFLYPTDLWIDHFSFCETCSTDFFNSFTQATNWLSLMAQVVHRTCFCLWLLLFAIIIYVLVHIFE